MVWYCLIVCGVRRHTPELVEAIDILRQLKARSVTLKTGQAFEIARVASLRLRASN